MSVRLSVCPSGLVRHVIFSAPNWDIAPIFIVQISLINEHLFCMYFVRLSVGNATKGFATYGCFHPCFRTEHKEKIKIPFISIFLSFIYFTFRDGIFIQGLRFRKVYNKTIDNKTTTIFGSWYATFFKWNI